MASQLVCFGMEKKGKRQHKYDEVSTVLGCAPFSLDANGYVVGNFVRIGERGTVFPTFCAEGIVSGAAPLKSDKESGSKGGLQYTCDFGKLPDAVAAAYAEWTDSLCELMWVAINEVKTHLEGDQEDDCPYYNPKSNIELEQVDAFIASMKLKYGGKGTDRHFRAFVEEVVVKKCATAAAKTGREVKASSSPHLKIWASLKRFSPPTLIYQMSEDLKTKTPINGDDLDETAAIMKKVFPAPKEGSFVSARAILRVGPTRVCNSQMGFSIKPVLHEIAIIGTPCDAQSTRAAAARRAIEEEDAEEGITIAARGSTKLLVATKTIVEDDDVPKKKKTKHDSDDEEPAPKKKKPAVHVASDDDDEPKPKKKRPVVRDEDDEPKPRKSAVRDEELPKTKSRKPVSRDEDSEDDLPKPKSRKPVSRDEDSEDEAPRAKKEDDVPKKKSRKPVSDDEDEPRPKSRKSVVREEEPRKKKPVSDDEEEQPKPKKPKHKPIDEDSDDSSVSSSPPVRKSKHADPRSK